MDVRPLPECDLEEADRIFRLAFGTFVGLPDPMQFAGDAEYIRPRWRSPACAAIGAYESERLIGSNVVTRWGRFGFFGPLTVLPEYWDRGVGQMLLQETMRLYEDWGTDVIALFTFPQSTKHVGLYQKFGFWPQMLTAVMAKDAEAGAWPAPAVTYAALPPQQRNAHLTQASALTNEILPGLDVAAEIETAESQQLGDTVFLLRDGAVSAFAVCHMGAGSEAGSGTLFVKFGAVRPGAEAALQFAQLLDACEALCAQRGLTSLVAGVNTARLGAYQHLLQRGFRAQFQGVAMQRPHVPGTLRSDCFVLDDWR